MAPQPKAPGHRVRRNVNQAQWQTLEPAPKITKAPKCPTDWSKETKEWWAIIWRSPMASMWIEADVPELHYLGSLIELPKKSAEHIAEIRQLKDRFGLNPKARRALMWNVPIGDADAGDLSEALTPSNLRRLKAV